MVVTSVRFPDDVYKKVKEMADFSGVKVTTYMREAILEKIEDQEDYEDCVAEDKEITGTVSREEVKRAVFGSGNE